MLEDAFDWVVGLILGLEGAVAYAVVTALTWAEAAFFLGLITPGEIAMALGGVLASIGQVDVVVMAALAATGTILGNSTGYWLGRRWGRQLTEWDRFQRRLGDRFEDVEGYFEEHGGRAIVVGRFASFLRVFIPFIAGSTRMPYGRFLAFDVPTSAAWATGFVTAGYVLGRSWEVLRDFIGPAGALLLALIVVGFLIRWGARRVAARQESIQALAGRLRESAVVSFVEERYGRQLRFLMRRLDPRVAQGLGLTVAFASFALGMVLVGLALDRAIGVETVAGIDLPFINWVHRSTTDAVELVAEAVVVVTGLPWVLVPLVVLTGLLVWRVGEAEASRLLLAAGGVAGFAWLLDASLPPGTVGTQLPVLPVAVVTSVTVHLASLRGARAGWRQGVTVAAIGAFATVLVGVATIVTGDGAPTGIGLAVPLALAWSAALEVERRLPAHLTDSEVHADG